VDKQDACNPLASFLFLFLFGFCFLRFFCFPCFIFRFMVYRYRTVVCFLCSFSLIIVFLLPWFSLKGQTGAKRGGSLVVEIIVLPNGSILSNHVGMLQYLGFLSYLTPAGACRVLPTRFLCNCGESIDSLSVLFRGPNNSVRLVPTPALQWPTLEGAAVRMREKYMLTPILPRVCQSVAKDQGDGSGGWWDSGGGREGHSLGLVG